MTTQEFVVMDHGVETDWIDPVEKVTESDVAWHVDNGHSVYRVGKKPGRVGAVRERGAGQ